MLQKHHLEFQSAKTVVGDLTNDRGHHFRVMTKGDNSDYPDQDKNANTENSSKVEDSQNNDGNSDNKGRSSSGGIFRNFWFKVGIGALVLLLIIGGLVWWLIARNYENTDDAFIDAHTVQVSSQIAGQIVALYVNDNQLVREGQPLAEINVEDATVRLAQVEAQKAQTLTQYQQASATEGGMAALAESAERDLARYHLLQRTAPAAVDQQQIDQAVAADRNAAAQRDAARAQIASALTQIKVLDAQVAAARLNLGYTHIVAPIAGHIAQRNVAAGNYVSPGQELLAIVPLQFWVTANFKETQLALIRPGQPVTVAVDACGDADVRGHVDSIQHGAGQAFGILPPENATGNYVKVVQRVPVKIILDRVPKECVLGPGMSVEPSVKVR
jgi:membrane fusion protein (multidrug efflux system)